MRTLAVTWSQSFEILVGILLFLIVPAVLTLSKTVRQSPLLMAGTIMLGIVLTVGLLAPWIAPYSPRAIVGDPFQSPSASHLLGTNDSGSDIFSRLVWGARTMMIVATFATSLVLLIGLTLGLTAGLRGGWVDTAIMRVVDVFLGLPVIPLLIFVSTLAGPSLKVSILMIGFTLWPQTARIVRSQALTLRTRGYVDCARGFGAGPFYLIRRHLLPTLGPIIAANLVYMAGLAVATEAGMAFLGLGDPSAVSWGTEIQRAVSSSQLQIGSIWLWWLVPFGLALAFAVFGFSLIGVGLEPRFNPRWSRTR